MRVILVVAAAALLSGCPGKAPKPPEAAQPEKVDNAATRYVGGLQNSLEKARKAAAATNAADKAREEEAQKVEPAP